LDSLDANPLLLIYKELLKLFVPQPPISFLRLAKALMFSDLTSHSEPVDFIHLKNNYLMHYMYVCTICICWETITCLTC